MHICSMKNCLFIFFICFGFFVQAQTTAANDARLKTLSDKCAEYHRKTDGESDGYRIKIHFGIDKMAARDVKQKFSAMYAKANVIAYEEYRQPNFVIVVGDFKTRVEAFEVYKTIQSDFPNAFIIKSKIKPNK
jgi:hypothetical protein